MKSVVIAIALVVGAIGAASAQTAPTDTTSLKACVAKVNAMYPLALGVALPDGGWFKIDACLHGML